MYTGLYEFYVYAQFRMQDIEVIIFNDQRFCTDRFGVWIRAGAILASSLTIVIMKETRLCHFKWFKFVSLLF